MNDSRHFGPHFVGVCWRQPDGWAARHIPSDSADVAHQGNAVAMLQRVNALHVAAARQLRQEGPADRARGTGQEDDMGHRRTQKNTGH
jgi:hypothetical protein